MQYPMITHPMKYLYSFFADALPALSWCVVGDIGQRLYREEGHAGGKWIQGGHD
jgi:hypothetical protein